MLFRLSQFIASYCIYSYWRTVQLCFIRPHVWHERKTKQN